MDPLVQTLGKSFEILLRNLKLCLDLAKSPSVNMFVNFQFIELLTQLKNLFKNLWQTSE